MPRGNLIQSNVVTTSIKVDEQRWKEFKIACIELDLNLSDGLHEALILYINKCRAEGGEEPIFLDLLEKIQNKRQNMVSNKQNTTEVVDE